jgi:hypothetical protein
VLAADLVSDFFADLATAMYDNQMVKLAPIVSLNPIAPSSL